MYFFASLYVFNYVIRFIPFSFLDQTAFAQVAVDAKAFAWGEAIFLLLAPYLIGLAMLGCSAVREMIKVPRPSASGTYTR